MCSACEMLHLYKCNERICFFFTVFNLVCILCLRMALLYQLTAGSLFSSSSSSSSCNQEGPHSTMNEEEFFDALEMAYQEDEIDAVSVCVCVCVCVCNIREYMFSVLFKGFLLPISSINQCIFLNHSATCRIKSNHAF